MSGSRYPEGTVAFLFTDIQGSTKLWERDRATMAAVVDRHNDLLRSACEAHGGVLFKTIGDAIQGAFWSPIDAVRAAVDGQRLLTAETWEETGPILARMAVHLGEATPRNGDYMAYCLNRLSRLLSTGYGGQVLLSDEIRKAVERDLPDGVTLRPLGLHHLRDLLEPEAVSQLVIAGMPDQFPPLNSLERHPHNLPTQLTPLVGRTAEIAALSELLNRDEVRLVTLTGPGGVGKTRLSIQVAADLLDRFDHGAFLIDLQAVREPGLVIPAIAATLGVREASGQSIAESLTSFLASRRTLLVLDNLEQVVAAAPEIARLLAGAPGLKIIGTSRELLNIRGERELPISPLPLPGTGRRKPSLDELATVPAVELFVQRATLAKPSFHLNEDNAAAVAEICRRVDGLPLAIELAAARIKMLQPAALLQRLGNRLSILTGGARDLPERQQTLRALIAWSYDLLREPERALFRKASVFAGGASFDAIERIEGETGDAFDLLTSLVEKSLLRQSENADGEARFTMLETLREFGAEQLTESGEESEVRQTHADWYRSLAQTAREALAGPEEFVWLDRLGLEHDNLRAALARFQATDAKAELDLAGQLWEFWFSRGFYSEGRRWLDDALTRAPESPPSVRLLALIGAGTLALAQSDSAAAKTLCETGLNLARDQHDAISETSFLTNLGVIALNLGDLSTAETFFRESLQAFRDRGYRYGEADALVNIATVFHIQGNVEAAVSWYQDALTISREIDDKEQMAHELVNLVNLLAPVPERQEQAKQFAEESLTLSEEVGDQMLTAIALVGLGHIAEHNGDLDQAEGFYRESRSIQLELGNQSDEARAILALGNVALIRGDLGKAAVLCRDALGRFDRLNEPDSIAYCFDIIAKLAAAADRNDVAARLLGATDSIRSRLGVPVPIELVSLRDRTEGDIQSEMGRSEFEREFALGKHREEQENVIEAMSFPI